MTIIKMHFPAKEDVDIFRDHMFIGVRRSIKIIEEISCIPKQKHRLYFRSCSIQFDTLQSLLHHKQQTDANFKSKRFTFWFHLCTFGESSSTKNNLFSPNQVEEIQVYSLDDYSSSFYKSMERLLNVNQMCLKQFELVMYTKCIFPHYFIESIINLRKLETLRMGDIDTTIPWLSQLILNNNYLTTCEVDMTSRENEFLNIWSNAQLQYRNLNIFVPYNKSNKQLKHFLSKPSTFTFKSYNEPVNSRNKQLNCDIRFVRGMVGVMKLAAETGHTHSSSILDILLAFVLPRLPDVPVWFQKLDYPNQYRLCCDMYQSSVSFESSQSMTLVDFS